MRAPSSLLVGCILPIGLALLFASLAHAGDATGSAPPAEVATPTVSTPLSPAPVPPPVTTSSAEPPVSEGTPFPLVKDPIEPPKLKLPGASSNATPPPVEPAAEVDYTTRRFEPAGFPLLGGDSDIGFEFGVVGTLSHFADGIRPYAWNMDVVLSTSVKNGPSGPEFVQQSYLYNGDFVGFMGGKLRFNPQVQYQRTINMGYFGLGNAASSVVPANYSGPNGRYFEWVNSITNAFIMPRYTFREPWSVAALAGYTYMDPTAYADSKLARDALAKNPDGSPVIRGLRPLSVTQLAVGGIYDSRDEEIFAHKGAFGQVGVAYRQGFPTDASVVYGESQALISVFRPLGPFVIAGHAVADFEFGHVPFYDLFMAGPFGQSEAVGGGAAVRGVPVGRYSGEIKLYGTVEVRSMFLKFHLLKQKIAIGADALFDTGRSWLDYTFRSPLDGSGVGLKYGVGGGIYCLWGQAAIFRIDAAYSPDAAAENPHFPIGLYVNDGTSF